MTATIIQTENLSYVFSKGVKTLDNINLHVPQGSVYGFLGPNGAGKTTTLRLILGLLKVQNGSIKIFGEDFAPNRISILRRIGSLIEQPSLYGHLTAKENLEVYRKIYGAAPARIGEVLQLVDLHNTGSKKAKQFSLGMKQRLSIAIALLHNPPLLILDEPTNGLDPNGIIEIRELVKKLNRESGVTVLVSSHILAEVEKMASHVGIIHKGALLFQGSLQDLQSAKNKTGGLQIKTSNNTGAAQILQTYQPQQQNGSLILPYQGDEAVAQINKLLVQNGVDVYLLQPQSADLEQSFLQITAQ